MTAGRNPTSMRAVLVALGSLVVAACSSGGIEVVASRSDQIRTTVESVPITTPVTTTDTIPDTVVTTEPAIGDDRQSSIPSDDSPPPDSSNQDAPDMPGDTPMSEAEVEELLVELAAGGFCDPDDVRDDGIVTAMHFVVQGNIQPPCYVDQRDAGDDVADVVIDDDPRLLDAWESLTAITPIELVSDISLLAGYEPCSDCDTLAFVTTLDEDATFFLLAVDVVSGDDDPDELRLTMMHELSHVFGQKPGEQLDVSASRAADCATFFNGAGCFTKDSYLWAWIEEFWPVDIRDSLPDDGSVGTSDEADDRCDSDAGYTGSYAAVHPEEDFAETFSAYVYDVEVDPGLDDKFAFFERYPEFVSIRDNARALGLAGTEANFEGCG